MNEKLMLVGAGSAVFTKGLVSDLLRQEWEGELRLVDLDPQALAVAEKLAAKMLAAKKSRVKLSASVGDSVMPGGASRALRMIPAMSSGTSRKSLQRPAGSWCGDAWQHNCMIRRLAMSDFTQHDEKHP
jgi:alpha-galactosidase/6-phospho-beta-glucosidase family protein